VAVALGSTMLLTRHEALDAVADRQQQHDLDWPSLLQVVTLHERDVRRLQCGYSKRPGRVHVRLSAPDEAALLHAILASARARYKDAYAAMTDTDHRSPTPTPESAAPASALASAQARAGHSRTGGSVLAVVLLVLLAVILGGALYYQNHQYRILQADLEQQHAQNTQLIQDTRTQAGQALALVQEQTSRIQQLGEALETTSAQVQELDQALRLMTDSGSELLLINDIDHLITIAQQQLALGGNVANALIS